MSSPIEIAARPCSFRGLCTARDVSRRYRNRRIGEFLKELDLTEGRSTGIPRPDSCSWAAKQRGEMASAFRCGRSKAYPEGMSPRRPHRKGTVRSPRCDPQNGMSSARMLRVLRENGSPTPVFETDDDRAALVLRLLVQDLIEMTLPEKPNSRLQKYRLTAKGRALVE